MAATPQYLVGKVIAITADGRTMYATKSDSTRSVNVIKVTNAKSLGFQELRPGIKSAKGSVECVFNGEDLIDLELGKEISVAWAPTGGTAHTFQALVTNIKDSFVVDGDATYSFDWESSGAFT